MFYYPYLDIDDCASDPCLNDGNCEDGVAEFTCNCAPGWAGDTCQESEWNSYNLSCAQRNLALRN